MRLFAIVLAAVAACAHAPRSTDPINWVELQSEHFLVRSDLPADDAKRSVADMEQARAALMVAGWHGKTEPKTRIVVVQLASVKELEEFAAKDILGFKGRDAFGQPLIVVYGADVLDEAFFKHELTHVINESFLLTKPRWVDEGVACYLETLKINRGEAVVGKVDRNRTDYLAYRPVKEWFRIIDGGSETLTGGGEYGYRYETGASAIIRYLLESNPTKLDLYFNQLAKGTESSLAFSAAFPGLTERELGAAMHAFLQRLDPKPIHVAFTPWTGEVSLRGLPPADVYALRADLLRMSVGMTRKRPELVEAELVKALAADPANPYALMQREKSDGAAAVAAHPDDWRSWVVASEHKENARPNLERALALAPGDPVVLTRLAIAEARAQEPALGLRHAKLADELAPGRSDILEVLAYLQADNGLCVEAQVNARRAIDAFPDAMVEGVPASLRQGERTIRDHCDQRAAKEVALKLNAPPVYAVVRPKACKKQPPKLAADLHVDLTINQDGSMKWPDFVGQTTRPERLAIRDYLESCTYDPVLVDGKPAEARRAMVIAGQN